MTAPLAFDDTANAYAQDNPDGPTQASVYDGTTADPAISARTLITLAAGETPVIGARRVDHANATDYGFGADGIEYFITTSGGDLIPDVAGLIMADVLANDLEQGSGILHATLAIDTPPTQGAAAAIGGMLYYAPIAGVAESYDSLTYTVDNTLAETSNAATLTVSVGELLPVSLSPLRVGILPGITAFFDPQGQLAGTSSEPPRVLEVEITTAPVNGTASVVGRTVQYTSASDVLGEDTFSWRVLVNGQWTDPAMVTVAVGQTWRKPGLKKFTRNVITAGPPSSPIAARPDDATTPYGTPITVNALGNDIGTGISIVAIGTAVSGAVPVDNLDGTITYTPPINFSGGDSFLYTISDGIRSSTARVSIEVGSPPLIAVTDVASTELTDPVNIAVLGNDVGVSLEITDISDPAHGTAALNGDGITIDYQADGGFTGLDTFTYEITDGVGNQAAGLVRVTVLGAAPPAMVLLGDNVTTPYTTPIVINVLENDTGDSLTVQSVSGLTPAGAGAVAKTSSTQATFTPTSGFTGIATFTYVAVDASGNTGSQICTIAVTAPPAATYANGYEQKANTYIGPDTEAMTAFPVLFDFQHPALRTQINGGSVRAQYQDIRLEDGAGNKLSHGMLFHDVMNGRIQGIYKRSRSASAWNSVEVYCGRQAGAVDEQDWAGATAGHHLFCRSDTGVDLTGNARHLTPTSVIASTLFGFPAGQFNGTTSKLELANPSAWLNGTSAFTLLLDLQHDQIAVDQGFFRVGGTSTGSDTACAMMARSDAALLADPTKLALYFAKQDTSIAAVTTNCPVNGEATRIQSGKPSCFAMAWTSGAAQEFFSDDLAETEITKGVATPTGTLVVPGGPMAFGFGPRSPWAGTMGLVRMANSRRSDAWIRAEQRNRLNPLLMIAAGAFRAPAATAPCVAFPDTATANGSTPTIDISPLANDTGTGLSILSVGTPTNGAAVRQSASVIRYTQTTTFSGVAYIPYTIQDSLGRQSSSVIAVAVSQAAVTARADTYTVSASAMTELQVLANDDPPGLLEVDAITVQGTKGTAAASADKSKVEYTAGAVTGADSFTYRAKVKGGSATGTATVALTISAPATFPARLYQPMHRPLVEADIEVFRIGIDTSFVNNDWSKYLLLVWPDAIFTGTCNFNNLKYKGVFEVGGHYGPIGTTDKWRNSGITKVEPALKGNGGMLERSFGNPPLAHRTPTTRVYWWCDGLLIDTCAQTGDVLGRTQSCWWGDFWKTGVVRTSDGLYVDRASDAFIQRTDIQNSNYFFSEWTGSAGGGQACHSDWLQNESICMRSLNIWMFHGLCNGQGFYVTPDQSFDTATGLPKGKAPRDGFIEMSYCHFEPMPWDPVSDKFPNISDLKYVALAQKNSTNANDTTATFTDAAGNTHNVPAAYYWGLYVGPEVYLQETADGCDGRVDQLLGKPYNTTASYTRNATARTYTWTVDKRCFDASLHDYYVLGATGGAGTGLGGMWGRADGWLKRSASIDAPSYQMVPTAARGRSRRITTAAGLLAYLDSGV